jgi:hypothetical protein
MPDIPRDIGVLAKEISDYKVEGTEDLRHLTDMCRALAMEVSEVFDLAGFEIFDALRWFDRGQAKRARVVTRPMRHAQALVILASRRAAATYKTYLKTFGEEISRKRNRGSSRTFNPEK